MKSILLIEVIDQGLYTFEAYRELALQMSTGDFHTHKQQVVWHTDDIEHFAIDDKGEFYLVNEEC